MHGSIGYRVFLGILFALLLAGCAGEPAPVTGRVESPAVAVEGTATFPDQVAPAEPIQQSQSLDAALAELDGLPIPEGIDVDVFTELKVALAQALAERFAAEGVAAGGKLASTPPMDDRSVPTLSWSAVDDILSWRYFSTGDYNQDGFVTINDLTSLGQNYLAEAPTDLSLALSCVDGNGDGLITINDITQIGQGFGNNVVLYRVYMSESTEDYPESAGDDNGAATLLGEIAFSDAEQPVAERLLFNFVVDKAQADWYCWARPVDNEGQEGIASESLQFPPATWHTTLVTTTHWAGGIDLHPINGKPAIVYNSYEVVGEESWGFMLYVRATDDLGRDWGEPQEISNRYGSGFSFDSSHLHLVETTGHPAMFWVLRNSSAYPVIYAPHLQSATDADGNAWQSEQELGSFEFRTQGLTTGVIDGKPAYGCRLKFVDHSEYHFYLAVDAEATGWQESVVHPSVPALNRGTLLVADGHPALGLGTIGFDFPGAAWFRASDPQGEAWNEPVPVFDEPGHLSAWLIDGIPAVAAYHHLENILRFKCAVDEQGSSWPALGVVVASPYNIDMHCLREVQGRPAISFVSHSAGVESLYYLRANDSQGNEWPEPELLITSDKLLPSAMDEVNGDLAIVYAIYLGEGLGSEVYYTSYY